MIVTDFGGPSSLGMIVQGYIRKLGKYEPTSELASNISPPHLGFLLNFLSSEGGLW